MADSDILVRFSAETTDLKKGAAEAETAIKGLAARLKTAFAGVGADTAQHDALRAAQAEIDGEIAANRAALKQREEIYQEGVKLHLMSQGEMLAASKTAIDAEYQAEKELLQKELTLDGLKIQQKQEINNKLTALDSRYAQETQKLFAQVAEKQAQVWDKMVDGMSNSLTSGIMGMIKGTETFHKAMIKLADSMVQMFVKMGVDMVADWAKKQIALVILNQTAQGQQTAATIAGATAREGATAGEAASGMAATIANAIKSITVSAGQAGAGVTAFMAPFVGPAALAEGVATQGAVLGMASYDIGAWSIPQDQVAMVHRNELVMPAAEAGAFRSMLSGAANGGGGATGGDTHVHLNATAMDAGGVRSFLSNNSRQIMKAMNQAVHNGSHLGLSRLG